MSKKEKIKAKITFLNSLIIAFLTTLFAIFGYSFINFKNLNYYDLLGVSIACLFLFFCIVLFLKFFIKELNKLEKED
ncbi:hypothetical protein [Campylobacter upsaliensis]|uniref:Uncharacterized protein n=1 Tax=Campylobacter upsaliensis TaxID=28080 RepID=A0A381EJH6_CAMUP|nr:hypothetical protein [Campylobacter upsaliensis]SUX27073.1 Uncharacterised protein [Campylobacter upsaliensis]